MPVRTIILKLHLWLGLAAALLTLVLAATGTLLVYGDEIDRMLHPKLLTVAPQAGHLPLDELAAKIRQRMGNRPIINLGINRRPDVAWQVILGGKGVILAYVNPHTGQMTGSRPRASFVSKVHQLHTNLLLGRRGERLVAWGTAVLTFLMVTGFVLWWKRKLLTVQTTGSWRRINFDLHHISGIYSAAVLLIVVFTGLLMAFPSLYPAVEVFTGSTDRDGPGEKLESRPRKDDPGISPDKALAIATAQLPGASPMFFGFPVGPKGVYDISFKFPEDRTPGGRSHVIIEQFTGEVLWRESSREATKGVKFVNMVRPLHTGDILGWPTRLLYALASFSVVVQSITGVLIWLSRWLKKRRGKFALEPVEGPL